MPDCKYQGFSQRGLNDFRLFIYSRLYFNAWQSFPKFLYLFGANQSTK